MRVSVCKDHRTYRYAMVYLGQRSLRVIYPDRQIYQHKPHRLFYLAHKEFGEKNLIITEGLVQ